MDTKIGCQNDYITADMMKGKESEGKPDLILMEYKHFFRLISYYLPMPVLYENKNFVNWLRNTPGLPYEFASEVAYVLP